MFLIFMICVCRGKNSKSIGSLKTGSVCQLSIKVYINNLKVNAQYCNIHIWHAMKIGKERMFTEDRSMITGTII